ncbi:MAG: hypothetical protein L0H53_09230 [Candidatus Nitrosocosmicus sp.]|nr:hypothetical protein [Candidatus Nitrosocosmicus sp.]MDN5867698.1 hypothetical protein [Candidatus Nitrosocosmicus sp.]
MQSFAKCLENDFIEKHMRLNEFNPERRAIILCSLLNCFRLSFSMENLKKCKVYTDVIEKLYQNNFVETNLDNNSDAKQENATGILVDLNGARSDDPRSSTGAVFFKTNAIGQLGFLDDVIAIYQVKASPEGTDIRMWGWKGADLQFE